MSADLDAIRARRDAFRDAYAAVLRAAEPQSDRADQYQRAQHEMFSAAFDVARDVPELIAEIERLRALEARVRELAGIWVAIPSRDVYRALDGER